jgi:hypothetical protein
MGYIILWEGYSLLFPDAVHVPWSTETLTYDFIPMIGLFMLALSFASNTDTQKPHTHVFTSHMVVIVHLKCRKVVSAHFKFAQESMDTTWPQAAETFPSRGT